MNELRTSITKAFEYLSTNSIEIPTELLIQARVKGVGVKAGYAAGDLTAVNKAYHDAITKSLVGYFDGGAIGTARNKFKQAMINAFGDAFDLGWVDGGQDLPVGDEAALSWLEARMNQEVGYIDMLFQEAKELKKDAEFDYFAWITARADGYTNTLKEIYNSARARAMKDQMVTFAGDDGEKSCDTCKKLKGKRKKLSWFIANNYIPPFGSGLDCSKGGHCNHGLMNDKGDWITV